MGWIMSSKFPGKAIIYNYYNQDVGSSKKGTYTKADPEFFNWQIGEYWLQHDQCIKYINTAESAIRLTRVGIKTMSCNSNGQSYWSYGGGPNPPVTGKGGKYYAFIQHFDANENLLDRSYIGDTKPTIDIPDVGPNMIWAGDGSTLGHTAIFDSTKMTMHTYETPDCPAIQPGEGFYLHLGIGEFTETWLPAVNIMFLLVPGDMDIYIEPAEQPAIWRFEEDRKWHLVKRLYKMTGSGWTSMYDK